MIIIIIIRCKVSICMRWVTVKL